MTWLCEENQPAAKQEAEALPPKVWAAPGPAAVPSLQPLLLLYLIRSVSTETENVWAFFSPFFPHVYIALILH